MSNESTDDLVEEEVVDVVTTPTSNPNVSLDAINPRKKQHVFQDITISREGQIDTDIQISLPSDFDKEAMSVLEKAPNINLLDNIEGREWASVVSEGLELATVGEVFTDTLSEDDCEFRQSVDTNGKKLQAQSPKFKNVENQNLKGERATIRLISHLGIGSLFQVPLWHSGIWITFKPPTDSEFIELNRMILSDKIKFGRYTYGLAFSNVTVYTINRLVDFALAHIYDMSVKSEDININNIKDHINCQDIPILLWGLVCANYPKGFNYRRACVNDIEKCTNVIEEVLNVFKLQWTNIDGLTDWQKSFMSDRQSKQKSLDEVNRYKDALAKLQSKKIYVNKDLSNEVAFTIHTPSITEYITSGYKWISELVDGIDSALELEGAENERNDYIISKGQATSMRQYFHWIEGIEYASNIIDDIETLESTLDILSSDDSIREEFITEVVKYINESTISIIGIPTYTCNKCNKDQITDTYPKAVDIIPLDVVQLFFALLSQNLSRLAAR